MNGEGKEGKEDERERENKRQNGKQRERMDLPKISKIYGGKNLKKRPPGGQGGSPKSNFFVTYNPMQNFGTLR